ncbi:amidohydrolase family protein [Zoogloea sp.]|uniref:amidohydrolase family protein n=1 Tax=Zoogloea sp. TaxID=49181 RepID=UPI0035AFE15D
MTHDPQRRRMILALSTALLPLPGCTAATATLCPNDPVLSDLKAPLTVDVHAHVFNGSDLQIREFLSQTVIGPDSELRTLVREMGAVLQALAWNSAPSAREEARQIDAYTRPGSRCADNTQLREAAAPAFQDGYARGRRELQAAAQSTRAQPGTAAVLGPHAGLPGPGLGAAIDALPPTFEEFDQQSREPASVLGSQPHLAGYLQFVLHHFNHRHVNALDYLATYSPNSTRKIDLLVPCMVDYDFWLAKGRPTKTSLDDQVDLMARIAVLTGGRVHGFVPFCPFRELMTAKGDEPGESLRLVQRAIQSNGFIGVKLYPPMGFAPLGNSGLRVWKGKPTLPPVANDGDFGKRLDGAMRRLFIWCRDNDVPVMAHANHSNGPYEEFKDLAGPEYWQQAIDAFPGLKVSFGHFGDTDSEDHDGERAKAYLRLMTSAHGSKGENVYADASYFAGVLTNPVKMAEVLADLYTDSERRVLTERLMYGTDWTMLLPQKNVERYLQEFMGVMRRVEQSSLTGVTPRGASLSDAFFGDNAVSYLGLSRNKRTRARLEAFYDRHQLETPDWMKKIG